MRRNTKSSGKSNEFHLAHNLTPKIVNISELQPLGNETRKHKGRKLAKLAINLDHYGQVLPILVDAKNAVIAGWATVLAAQKRGLTRLQVVQLSDLTEADARALRLSLNKLQDDSDWDTNALRVEFQQIFALNPSIDIRTTGFEIGEVDRFLNSSADEEDDFARSIVKRPIIAEPGDLFQLENHAIYCGDAVDPRSYHYVLGAERAQMVFADPPYNVSIRKHAGGKGRVKHAEFAQASGEMASEEFQSFLRSPVKHSVSHSIDGAILFICIDWRHYADLLAACSGLFSEMKNLCVWAKSNAGMGSLYRSQHELVAVFKTGKAPHINNVQLGRNGRSRSNVWEYPSQNTLSNSTKGKLAFHPTVKPVALVADAIRDCSNIGGIILDPFGGAGTTLIAAERTGRRARLIEIEPSYVDVTIRRWQTLTGKSAVHAATGKTFDEVNGPVNAKSGRRS